MTKSVPDGKVVAGNPARIICDVEDYVRRYGGYAVDWSSVIDKRNFFENNPEYLIRR